MVGGSILEAKRDLSLHYLWLEGTFENPKDPPPPPLVEVRGERDSGKRDLPYVLFEIGWRRLRVKKTKFAI